MQLSELVVCNQSYKVKTHFIAYPKMKAGEFISLRSVTFDQIMEESKKWNKQK